jgi:hypothetical protein
LRVTKFILSLLSIFFLISFSLQSSDEPSLVLGQGPTDPDIIIEFDDYEFQIDTSPEISEPELQVVGLVTLLSNHPFVSVNLTTSLTNEAWNVTVVPDKFNLSNYPSDQSMQEITVTVHAPGETENGTSGTVTIHGIWSYFPENGGIPSPFPDEGEIPSVHLEVTALNETSETNGDGTNGNGKTNDDKDDSGFTFDIYWIVIIAIIIVVIIIILMYKRKR